MEKIIRNAIKEATEAGYKPREILFGEDVFLKFKSDVLSPENYEITDDGKIIRFLNIPVKFHRELSNNEVRIISRYGVWRKMLFGGGIYIDPTQ